METSVINKRILAFNEVRDLHYHIGTSEDDDHCCIKKSSILIAQLKLLGLTARIVITTFSWEDTPLPSSVIVLPHPEMEEHASIEVFIPESQSWIDLDPIWDPGLYKVFKIAEWDGINPTPIGVPWIDRYTPERSAEVFAGLNSAEEFKEYFSKYESFVIGINNWINEIRKAA